MLGNFSQRQEGECVAEMLGNGLIDATLRADPKRVGLLLGLGVSNDANGQSKSRWPWALRVWGLSPLKLNRGKSLALGVDALGRTALMWSVHGLNPSVECLRLLLPASDALAQDHGGRTALMLASIDGLHESVELLLPKSDASARDKEGDTALILAARSGQAQCVELLLRESDPSLRGAGGLTASEAARAMTFCKLARLIDAYALAGSEVGILESEAGKPASDPALALKSRPRL